MKVQYILAMLLLLATGCKKTSKNHPVPYVVTDKTIDITLPSYSELMNVGGYCYVTGGSRGIIVYRKSTDEFVAWDRHSPNDPNGTCPTPLTPNPDNFLELDDPCSDGKFSLYDGSPISSSDWGLRQYIAVWNGSNQLRIYN